MKKEPEIEQNRGAKFVNLYRYKGKISIKIEKRSKKSKMYKKESKKGIGNRSLYCYTCNQLMRKWHKPYQLTLNRR